MRVKIYARVNTTALGSGTALATQVSECVKLANQHRYTVRPADVMRERASGLGLDRPRLNNLRRMVAANEVGALFVYKADRLSRNFGDLVNLLREFRDAGVAVHFVMGLPVDIEDMDRLLRSVQGSSTS